MKPIHPTTNLWNLMASIAAIAGLFAIYRQIGLGLTLLVCLSLGPGVLAWLAAQRRRRLAAVAFAAAAALAAVPLFLLCAYSVSIAGLAIAFIWAIVTIPPTLGFGIAWAAEVHRSGAPKRRTSALTWLLVIVSAALLVSMIPTLWPLRLAFLVSRPSMDRLADRIAAGETLGRSERAGLYDVEASRLEPRSGSVALLINDYPGGGSGFVRLGTRPPFDSPMINLNFDEDLGGNWRYQDED